MQKLQGFLFDLDGVLVDTARYHYQAWSRLAAELGFTFTVHDNERLKGVSRTASLEILLSIGGIQATAAQKDGYAKKKNDWYVEMISAMKPDEILPGVDAFLEASRKAGILTAVGSASKNTPLILERTGLKRFFDAVIDGNSTSRAKPDPEVFLLGAKALHLKDRACVVFEDAEAGIQAAKAAGMGAVGIGSPAVLFQADLVIRCFAGLGPETILAQFGLIV